jgi:hypothetical protein
MTGIYETPWLLEEVISRIRRFVVLTDDLVLAVGVLVLHSCAVEAAGCAPYLDVSSPTRECGKTRLFEALELLVHKPRRCTGHTEATLFRMIESEHPTLLLDEMDTTFGKDPKLYAGIRGVLDEGHRRGGTVPRMVGEGSRMQLKFFDVFGPKAFAGIGTLPETIASRSIPIRLQRKARTETIARLRYTREQAAAAPIRQSLEEWGAAVVPALDEAEPALPDELSDRQWDLWEPLFAIADLADRGADARSAAIRLHAAAYSHVSLELLALDHVRLIFNGDERMPTKAILEELVRREDGPWARWWARDVDAGQIKGPASKLARLLKPYGIEPKQLWIDGQKERGYEVADLKPVWDRYLGPFTPPNDGRSVGGSPDMPSDKGTTDIPSPGGVSGSERLPIGDSHAS